ncbi:hypothetical protein RHO13_04640 [Orbus wheelerorum]|uniref:hypothetical protein n=1 Tax=Orbus wheelerorum TaxID=3074111 RepID=UPI00370D4D09
MIYPAAYILFIGGAADKESFLWGSAHLPFPKIQPHYTMGHLANSFRDELNQKLIGIGGNRQQNYNEYYKIDYLSYTEVFFSELKNNPSSHAMLLTNLRYRNIKQNIGNNTKVYIIGHSLGGWNGAHLSAILSNFNINIECLVTLDPVGMGNHELHFIQPWIKKAQIYTYEPQPVTKYWFNIQARHINVTKKQVSGSFDDWVAWAGGQWLMSNNYPAAEQQICEKTNFSHKKALQMLTYPTILGCSAYDYLLNSILKVLSSNQN